VFCKPHIRHGRYFNARHESVLGRMCELVKTTLVLTRHLLTKPEKHCKKAAHAQWHEPVILQERSQHHITWLGHATFLIQIENLNILTDPVFNEISMVTPRYVDPVVPIEALPPIDLVIISHNHRDHMDERSLLGLKDRVKQWLVPAGDKAWFAARGFEGVQEMYWWEKAAVQGVEFTFLPAYHWSGRHPLDINQSLWGSWMIQGAATAIYFAGDTAYSQHFAAIARVFPLIDIVLMPIGPNDPHTMRETHVSAEEAVRGFIDLGGKHFVPMHWGTFRLGADTFTTPLERLAMAWQKHQDLLSGARLSVLKHGQHLEARDVVDELALLPLASRVTVSEL